MAETRSKEQKVIDLSDNTQYPASVLTDLKGIFSLGDDSGFFLTFLKTQWTEPQFRWGWGEITHEEAVNRDFLFWAFRNMNIRSRERRDAMIAAAGCQLVWGNKDLEPVPGLMSGEQLCDLVSRCIKQNLKEMKSLNASEDREARRWKLNPSFEDLMADMKKPPQKADFYHDNMGCGMLLFTSKSYGNQQTFIVNPALKKVYPIAEASGKLVAFTHDDIEWDNVNQLPNHDDAEKLVAKYYFSIDSYKDGVARVNWMLYPDGRYFADEDGFGMEDNDETRVSAYIDTECRVLVKFQDMEDPEKAEKLYQEALQKRSFTKLL